MSWSSPLLELRYCLRHTRVRAALAACAVAATVLVLVAAAYWWPTVRYTRNITAQIDAERQVLREKRHNIALARAVEDARAQIGPMESKFDAAATQAALVQQIARLAQRTRVRVLAESYHESKTVEGYQSLFHELTLAGSYTAVRNFLIGLNGLSTLTLIDEAALSRERDAGAGTIRAQLKLVTWRRPPVTGEHP